MTTIQPFWVENLKAYKYQLNITKPGGEAKTMMYDTISDAVTAWKRNRALFWEEKTYVR